MNKQIPKQDCIPAATVRQVEELDSAVVRFTGDSSTRTSRPFHYERALLRFRTLSRKGKRSTVVVTAIARELSAFIWAIDREVIVNPMTNRA